MEFLVTDNAQVLAYKRGPVIVALNLGAEAAQVKVEGMEEGEYAKWLDSKTILNGPSMTTVHCDGTTPLDLEAKGYEVYIKQ